MAIATYGVKFEIVVLKFIPNLKHKHEVATSGRPTTSQEIRVRLLTRLS
jgi:hypothetical protein